MASPMARPTPSTTAAAIPLRAAGTDTLNHVSVAVAPSASDASSYSRGTASSAVMATLMMDGRIMMASTMMAASRPEPSGIRNSFRMPGTSTSMPTRPYTTDGIPASRLTAEDTTAFRRGGAIFARNTAVMNPTGTPSRMAPAVPYTLVRMKDRMPNWGVAALESHTLPNRNFTSPISRMAGMPEMMR